MGKVTDILRAWRERLLGLLRGFFGRVRAGGAPIDMPQVWARQAAILSIAAVAVFGSFYSIDYLIARHASEGGPIGRFFRFDPSTLSNSVSALAGVNAAVFGIVITVVSIVVQLTANRYTGVARMFLRDRVNQLVASYYVVACVVSVWMSMSLKASYVPPITMTVVLSLSTGGLVLMAPYFGYVFWFVEPRHIIERIRQQAVKRSGSGAVTEDAPTCFMAQADTLFALEELTDITNNSITGRDKIIASAAVDGIKDFALEYLKAKPLARDAWFSVGPDIRLNPDFVAMDPESLADLETRRTWVEWKVMRQYLGIYNDALPMMRDINYLIAIDTRYIGEAAAKANDAELIQLVYRFFNSYIRSTLNAKDIRTSYNILNQYRKLVEAMLREGNVRGAIDGVRHMNYYGLVSFEQNLHFVTETIAYDVGALVELASELKSPAERELLHDFLELDRPTFIRGQEKGLLGVRKAQVKLATHYILAGEEQKARSIAADMRDEPQDRLQKLHHQLAAVESKDFWEIIDRGRNFEYMPAEQRLCLPVFFAWVDEAARASAAE